MITTFLIASGIAGLGLWLHEASIMGTNPFLIQIGWGLVLLCLLGLRYYVWRHAKQGAKWQHMVLVAGIFCVAFLVNLWSW